MGTQHNGCRRGTAMNRGKQRLVANLARLLAIISLLTLTVGLIGCGGGSDNPNPSGSPAPTGVLVTPGTVTLLTGRTQAFSATIANATNPAVTWRVGEGDAGGTIDSNGLYTAPATAGTYHVIATSVSDTSKTGVSIVTVQSGTPAGVTVSVNPPSAITVTGASLVFSATVSGTSNQGVTWVVQEGNLGGSITSDGLYSAPMTPGTYHVIAISAADSSATGVATITVQGGGTL